VLEKDLQRTGCAELCSVAWQFARQTRLGEACPGRASCSAVQAAANQAEATETKPSLLLRIPGVVASFALHTKNREYSGCGSSWVSLARPKAVMVASADHLGIRLTRDPAP
jgi:hypothetical protein